MPGTSPIKVKSLASGAVTLLFELYAEVVIAAHYHRGAEVNLPVTMLVTPVSTSLIDGVTVKPGDETLYIQAADLATVTEPRSGDYVIEDTGSLRRDIIITHLDPTRTMWTLVGRKVFS